MAMSFLNFLSKIGTTWIFSKLQLFLTTNFCIKAKTISRAFSTGLGTVDTFSMFTKTIEFYQKVRGFSIVRAVMSFTLMVLKKHDMLVQYLLPSITKEVISYLLVLGQQPFIILQIQNF